MGEDRTGPQSGRRVSVDEAARHLGLTVDAVRKRVQRGQIAHEKDAAGRVRIILDEGETLRDEGPDTTGQAAGAREELELLWDKALIIGFAKGYDEEDILDMPVAEIFAEED